MPDPTSATLYPADYLPIVSFDTSALNRIMKADDADAIIAAVKANRYVRLNGLCLEEIVCTKNPESRNALLSGCRTLVCENRESDCLLPQGALIEKLVHAHREDPSRFDWTKVPIDTWAYHTEVLCGLSSLVDDVLSEELRQEQKTAQQDYRDRVTSRRESMVQTHRAHGLKQPLRFRDLLDNLRISGSSALFDSCANHYRLSCGIDLPHDAAMEFMDTCPPIRAIVLSQFMSFFDGSMRDPFLGERFGAGRNDMYMSIYLPYCDEFVTVDGEQARCLRELAIRAGIQTDVLSYDEFLERLNSSVIKSQDRPPAEEPPVQEPPTQEPGKNDPPNDEPPVKEPPSKDED